MVVDLNVKRLEKCLSMLENEDTEGAYIELCFALLAGGAIFSERGLDILVKKVNSRNGDNNEKH